jgi:hypothetical protein
VQVMIDRASLRATRIPEDVRSMLQQAREAEGVRPSAR